MGDTRGVQVFSRLARRLRRAITRPDGRIVTQGVLTIAVLAGVFGLAVYAVPNFGPDWAYGADSEETSPAADETEDPLALPPGLDSAPGGVEVPTDDEESEEPGEGENEDESNSHALREWAESLSGLDIDARAIMAYGNAELVLAEAKPDCGLSWTTLAGIGKVETNHGTTNGTTLDDDGRPGKPIRGPALDGSNGNKEIRDTDGGEYDDDKVFDRAVGPMQFIPSTWERWKDDADADGKTDPNDIDDVAVAAGYYLCADGRDLTQAEDWYAAIFSYNHKESYVRDVYDNADAYGQASKA
ncbi:MAG: lytic transglycosylase domain-containing protein [Stackebrandtia sp.]